MCAVWGALLVKADPVRLREASRALAWPLPQRTTLVPTTGAGGAVWHYVVDGRNVLDLHCRQLGYGQYCVAGLAVLRTGAAP